MGTSRTGKSLLDERQKSFLQGVSSISAVRFRMTQEDRDGKPSGEDAHDKNLKSERRNYDNRE